MAKRTTRAAGGVRHQPARAAHKLSLSLGIIPIAASNAPGAVAVHSSCVTPSATPGAEARPGTTVAGTS